jgi:pyruvate ferredoxin oxidoreductase gamma subunit
MSPEIFGIRVLTDVIWTGSAHFDARGSRRAAGGRNMFQVRIHGRGGQGVVTAAELLSVAAFREGRHAQAFPSFGSERTGAPVVAFCRIDDRPIRLREPVLAPDVLLIQDPTLLHQVDVFGGLVAGGYILINTRRSFEDLGLGEFVSGLKAAHLCTVPATEIAMKHVGRPLPNAALLGGFAALSRRVSLESVNAAIREKFPAKVAQANVAAAAAAFEHVAREKQEAADAQAG